jgi:hypothetical protein
MSNATPEIDRWVASMREIVRQENARFLWGVYDYVVQNANGPADTVDCTPADPSTGAPSISGLVIWTGLPGSSCTPAIGSHLAIVFLDGNRAKPRVISFDATSPIPGQTPPPIVIGSQEPSPPVPLPGAAARVGDAAGPFLVTTGSSLISLG